MNSPYLLTPGDTAEPANPGDTDQGLDLRTYLRILKQNKWRIALYSMLFASIGLLIAVRSVPVYKAEVKLLAEPVENKVSTSGQWASTALVWLFYETQREIILSRSIALQVADKLDLAGSAPDPVEPVDDAPEAPVQSGILGLDWRLWLPEQWRPVRVEPRLPSAEERRQAAADMVLGGLGVVVSKESQIIVVSYENSDPQLAADVANAVAASYRDFGLSARLSKAREQTAFLNTQLKELERKVSEAETALADFQKREGLIDTGSRQQIVTAQLAGLSQQLVDAEAKRSEAQIRYREVQRLQKAGEGYESIAVVLKNSLVSRLQEKQSELRRRVSELSERYGEKHPKMIAARTELSEARLSLNQAIDKVVGSLKQEYDVARQQERTIKGRIQQRKGDIQGLQETGFEQSRLEREAENARKVYEQFLARLSELDVEDEYDISNVNVIDLAQVPRSPYKPNKLRLVAGAAMLGMLFGVLVSFLRDRMDSTFKLLEHAENRLNLAGLGIVPTLRRREVDSIPERVTENNPHSPFAESINHIRTGVLFSDIDNPPRVLMITSSVASEGKTTFAANLAFSFAQMGRTLLIECDLRKPRLVDVFGFEHKGGLTNVAMQPEQVQDWIHRVNDELDLYVLPAGEQLPNPLEFLSSESFKRLVTAFRKKFDYLVLDAPPVLPVSDAIVLSRHADGVIMAVKAESTSDKMAREAVKRLRAAHVRPLGVVLTQASAKRMAEYGGHYYSDHSYYGYGKAYGYGYGSTPAQKPGAAAGDGA